MRIIRASEINPFLFCQRAWSYQIQGKIPENQVELDMGKNIHAQHGRVAARIHWIRIISLILILLALALFAIYLVDQFI
jgi:hypothetical protein